MQRKRIKMTVVTIGAVVAGVGSGVLAGGAMGQGALDSDYVPFNGTGQAVGIHEDDLDLTPYSFPVNEAGQSFGSVALATTPDNTPDLVLVVVEGEVEAYVLGQELLELEGWFARPSSPDEAAARSTTNSDQGRARPMDVYDREGNQIQGVQWHGFQD